MNDPIKKQCPHCKSEINADATKCPRCQSDLRNWFEKHKAASAILSIVVVLLAYGQYVKFTDRGEKPSAYDAAIIARVFVRQFLKVPATADFPSTDEDKIVRDIKDKNRLEINSYVDAENSFGAKIRSDWAVRLKYKDGNSGDSNDIKNWELERLIFDGELLYPPQ